MMPKPEAFGAAFNAWIARPRDEAIAETGIERPIIAIDGESARRGHDASQDLGPPHAVAAWAGEDGLAPGQELCDAKSNEIAAIPGPLEEIDVRGGLVTIDATGARKAIAAGIIAGPADHVPSLKRNHESLHAAVIEHIDERLDGDVGTAQELTTTDRGHGREGERTCPQLPAPEGAPRIYASAWDVWVLWERMTRFCCPIQLVGDRTALVPSATWRTRSLQGRLRHDRRFRHNPHDSDQ
jgi:predicted transposase YbfD/YdcC